MTEFTPWSGLAGGILIGLAAVLLMASHGRIAGLSGIVGGLLTLDFGGEFVWRAIFIAGLLIGAGSAVIFGLAGSGIAFSGGLPLIATSGIIVGIGTALSSGCTSGHGICGLSRFSPRALVATCIFMGVAIATVFVVRHVLGG